MFEPVTSLLKLSEATLCAVYKRYKIITQVDTERWKCNLQERQIGFKTTLLCIT